MAQLHKLSPLEVRRSKKLGWKSDGGGLYLRTRSSGSKTWMFRFERNGKKKDLTLGSATTISLSKAREMATACRLALIEGRPLDTLFASQEGPKTFLDAANAIIERRKASWKSNKTAIKWRRGLMDHGKSLHNKPVNQITIQDVEGILSPIWYTQNHSARMIRGMIEQALDLATVLGWREGDNPARWKGKLEHLLPDYTPKVQHHAAMPYKDAPDFFRMLVDGKAHVTANALALTILTGSRGHMVRHATWSEFDLENKIWTIPASRMKKSDEDHIIPLYKAYVETVAAATSWSRVSVSREGI